MQLAAPSSQSLFKGPLLLNRKGLAPPVLSLVNLPFVRACVVVHLLKGCGGLLGAVFVPGTQAARCTPLSVTSPSRLLCPAVAHFCGAAPSAVGSLQAGQDLMWLVPLD